MASTNITAIAAQINEQHALAQQHAETAIEHARRAGLLLLEAKAQLEHGNWLSWLEANTQVSARSAQRYMRVAQGKPMPIRALKCDTVSHLDSTDLPARARASIRRVAGDYDSIVQRFEAGDIATPVELDQLDVNLRQLFVDVGAIIEQATFDRDADALATVSMEMARIELALMAFRRTQRQATAFADRIHQTLRKKFGHKVVDDLIGASKYSGGDRA